MERSLLAAVFVLLVPLASFAAAGRAAIEWLPFEAASFERARSEHKLVLLDLEAVWCHWCHVMDAVTYVDARVIDRLSRRFVAIKADHDARPDLANRYRDYGWPATIVFDGDGREIAKRAGNIPPDEMLEWLDAALIRPATERAPDVLPGSLTPELAATLLTRHRLSLDRDLGGLRTSQKFLDGDAVEYGLVLAERGDSDEEAQVRRTLDAARALVDPVWGGAYQYSTGRVWTRPHFEKLMRTQARYLRLYALGYERLEDARYLVVIDAVRRYLDRFLTSPDGTYYVSQDADAIPGKHAGAYFALDDVARRRIGVPRVDTHVYADANGTAIEALVVVHRATNDASALDAAKRAAARIVTTHRRDDGGFDHAAGDPSGPYLGDQVAMARAALELFDATDEPRWLADAQRAARYIDQRFRAPVGYRSGIENGTPVAPVPQIDENIAVACFAARLHRLIGDPASKAIFDHAMGYLTSAAIAFKRVAEPGILLAAAEVRG